MRLKVKLATDQERQLLGRSNMQAPVSLKQAACQYLFISHKLYASTDIANAIVYGCQPVLESILLQTINFP